MFFGEIHVGMVDRVPRVGYVVTRFHHLNFLPIAPLGSYFVFLGPESYEVKIPLSIKSVLMGWFRGACCFSLLVGCIFLAIECRRLNATRLSVVAALLAVPLVLLGVSYLRRFRNASHSRAMELANLLGLPVETRLLIDVAYGRKTPAQADLELANRESTDIIELSEFG
jgi:hypothetical protein